MLDSHLFLLKKAFSINIWQLIYIFLLKIIHGIFIFIEKTKLKHLNNKLSWNISLPNSIEISNKLRCFQSYYTFCNQNQKIIENTDKILNNEILLFGKLFKIKETDWLRDPVSGSFWNNEIFFTDAQVESKGYGDVKYVMELNKMGCLVALAQAYHLTNNEKYIQKINDYLIGWIKTVPYERSVVNKSILDIALRCLNLIHVTLLCLNNSFFCKEIHPRIVCILISSEEQIRNFSTPRWCKYSTGANHTIGEMVGLIVTQLWLEYFTNNNYDRYYKKEFQYLHNSLENIITAKGVYLEQSASYAKLVAEFLMLLDIFYKAIGNQRINQYYSDQYLVNLLRYISCLAYNNQLPNFGDNDGAKATYPFYEHEYSIEHLTKYYEMLQPGSEVNNSLICKESGQFIWKSDDAKKIYVFVRAGKHSFLPIGSGSHAHNDILSLILSINNEELFIDHGTFLYNSGIDVINNDRSTANHNTISIANYEQASFAGKWLYGNYPVSEFVDDQMIIGKSSFVFHGKCVYSGKSHIRRIEYNHCKFIINDHIDCAPYDEVSINFLLSPVVTAKKISDTNIELYKNDNKYAVMSFNDSININIKEACFYPSYGIEKSTRKIIGISNIKGSQIIQTSICFCQ